MKLMKFHYRLWIVFSFIWLAGLFILYWLIVDTYYERSLDNQTRLAHSQGETVARRLSGLIPIYSERAQGYVDFYSERFGVRLMLLSPDLKLTYDSNKEFVPGRSLSIGILEDVEAAPLSRYVDTDRFGLVQYTLMKIEQAREGGYLLMVQNVNGLNEDLRQFRNRVLLALSAATAVSFVVFYFVAAWFTRPIRQIMFHLRKVTPRKREFAMVYRGKDEIGRLVEEIRDMVKQMAVYEQRQRRFISTSSHELKTPLSTMQLILENLPQLRDQPELFEEYVSDLSQQIGKMRNVVQGMLDVYRMADRPLRLQLVNFTEIRQHVEEQFARIGENRNIRIRFEQLADGLDADRELLFRGLDNLVSNALRYSPEHTEITIRLEKNPIGWKLSVCDQGIGIAEHDLPYIFEAFYRSNNATSWSQEGSGLGLAIVKQMIDLHEGDMEVQSVPGEGTCVHLYFRNKSVT